MIEAVEGFLTDVERSDLLLLYFSATVSRTSRGGSTSHPATRAGTACAPPRSRRPSSTTSARLALAAQGAPARLLLRRRVREGMQVKADAAVRCVRARSRRHDRFRLDPVRLRRRRAARLGDALALHRRARGRPRKRRGRRGRRRPRDRRRCLRLRPPPPRRRRRAAEPAQVGVRRLGPHRAGANRGGAGLARRAPAAGRRAGLRRDRRTRSVSRLVAERPRRGRRLHRVELGRRQLVDFAGTWIDSDYKANSSLPVLLGFAGAWGAAYVLVAYLGGRRHDWRDPWRPPADAYRDLATPSAHGFGRGLVAAVPVNIVLIAIASMVAARLGYAWLGGSEGRDDASRFTLVVLALAGLVRYLTWPNGLTLRARARRSSSCRRCRSRPRAVRAAVDAGRARARLRRRRS